MNTAIRVIMLSFMSLGLAASLSYAESQRRCEVLDSIDSGGYTYFRCGGQYNNIWAAVIQTNLNRGVTVEFPDSQPMKNFDSKTLNIMFHEIYFTENIKIIVPQEDSVPADNSSSDAKDSETTK